MFAFLFSVFSSRFQLTSAPGSAIFLSAKFPNGIPPDCHPRAPLDGTAPQRKRDLWRTRGLPHAPLAAFPPLARFLRKFLFCRAESAATPATRAAETPSPANPAEAR